MARNGSGTYTLPAGNPVTTGTTISSTWANTTLSDIATALTQSIAYNGVTTPIANLPMGGYKLTGLGVATTSGDALSYGNAITASSIVGTSITDSGLTSGRVTYASTGGLLADSASLTFDGTNLGIANINGATLSLKTGGTTGLYIDGSQNVGIGTTSPSSILHTKVSSGEALRLQGAATSTFIRFADATNTSTAFIGQNTEFDICNQSNTAMRFFTNNSERMRIDSSGNVGIGTSSGITTVSSGLAINNATAGNYPGLEIQTAGVTRFYINANNSASYISSQSTNPMVFQTNGSERMRIDSSGNVLVGTTANINLGKQCVSFPGNAQHGIEVNDTTSTNGSQFITFFTGGSLRGYISNNNNTAVAYNTTSDYRLKENIAPMVGALDTVAQLKPVTYNWKADGSEGQGFIAHELQKVVPDCVTGEKDAVDADGNPVYQGIDTSFLIATLTAAIQELSAKVTALEAQVNGNTPSV